MRKRERGFTLIELVVIIVIIAILIAAYLYFTGGLGKDAKVSKLTEALDGYLQAYQSCKLKNATLNPTSWTEFTNALTDSQCRTNTTDGKGLASSVSQIVAGMTLNVVSGNPSQLQVDTGDTYIAAQVMKNLAGRGCTCPGWDPTNIVCSGTTVSCALQ